MKKDNAYRIVSCYESCNVKEKNDKPSAREQLADRGVENLASKDLLSVLLGSGTRGNPIEKLSTSVLDTLKVTPNEKLLIALESLNGMGTSKASLVCAALELGRRYNTNENITIKHPRDIIPLIKNYSLEKKEHFLCVSLNGANELIAVRTISVGILNRTIIHPREIFCDPIKDRAAAIILGHNHPSGDPHPSSDDIKTTERIYEASKILGIQLLDHIILGKNQYYSFLEYGTVL